MNLQQMTEVCGSCRWFRVTDGEDWGVCFESPPVTMIGEDDDGRMIVFFERPEVDLTDVCSRWKSSASA